ncbi:MAG TPA: hypothetical protein VIT45_16840 [Allosphingosinicella sp.]
MLRGLGIARPDGLFFDDIPMVKLDVERWSPHLKIIALKLNLALHYRYVGRPLSTEGRVLSTFSFNAQLGDGTALREFQEAAENLDNPRHGNEDLGDQVQVRWSVDAEHGAGAFLIHLHGTLFVFGITADHPEWCRVLLEDGEEDMRGPLQWD